MPDPTLPCAAPLLPLQALMAEPLPATMKGLPACAVGQPLSALGDLGLNVLAGDLPLPVAVLKASALAHNAAWMREFTSSAGASLCPHGKTTMAPQLFDLQLRAGAWGITAATAGHVRTYRRFGVPRVLMANQLVDPAGIALVLEELAADPGFDFYSLVDSLPGLQALQRGLQRRPIGRPLQVLLELGLPDGRTGVRTLEDAAVLGRAIRDAAPGIALRGIETYEGVVRGDDHQRVELAIHGVLERVGTLTALGCAEAWFAPGELILTAGGSAYFDLAAQLVQAVPPGREARVVLRSGCYLSHDSLHYERMQARLRQRAGRRWPTGPGLRNALEVWAMVQSVPEPGRAICGLGRRDAGFDAGLPQPLAWLRPGLHTQPQPVPGGLQVPALFDQHAYVDAGQGAVPFEVGDLVGFGIGHPCTTFDKWALLTLVDDAYEVIGGVRTFF